MGWKEKRFLRKLRKRLRKLSNCVRHSWVGKRCILCGISIVFEPYKNMSIEDQIKRIEQIKELVDQATKLNSGI